MKTISHGFLALIAIVTLVQANVLPVRLSSSFLYRRQETYVNRSRLQATQVDAGSKRVFAHYMLGNAYNLTMEDFLQAITEAKASGIDGFALNNGPEEWIAQKALLMYDAAEKAGGFVVFLSLDMTTLAHASLATLGKWVTDHASKPAQFRVNGKPYVTTFGGEAITFGQPTGEAGWAAFVGQFEPIGGIYFAPCFSGLGWAVSAWPFISGTFQWNAFTRGTEDDEFYLRYRNNPGATLENAQQAYTGKTYMAGIGTTFFSGFEYKNWVAAQDNTYVERWKNLVRLQPDFVELITWNDYGESSYMGSVGGQCPESGLVASANWSYGFPHVAWQSLTRYFANSFKAGVMLPVIENQLYYWYRPHSKAAKPQNPSTMPFPDCRVGNGGCPKDEINITLLLKQNFRVRVSSGHVQQTYNATPGLNIFSLAALEQGRPRIEVLDAYAETIVKSSVGLLEVNNTIERYNFNVAVFKESGF